MEYTFKNSHAEKPITLVLSEYSITVRTDGREKIIPYGDIQSVCLKRSGRKFFTIIKATNQPEIYISNHYWLSGNETDDKSREYVTFIRVLHFHLRTKSQAYYVCGNNLRPIFFAAGFSIIAAFGISYTLENFQLNPFNSMVTSLILSTLGIFVIALLNTGRFPKVYIPENIPLQFLPFN